MMTDVQSNLGIGPMQGDVLIGRFRLDRLLGEGAWARVWLARDLTTLSPVAVKVLKGAHHSNQGGHDQFDHEASVLARLRSPHIVRIGSIEKTETGLPFLVMEYVRGLSVRQILVRHGPLDPGSVARLADGVLRALKVAHAEGLVHRDIKPSNLLVTRAPESSRPVAKVVDFGVATALSEGVSNLGDVDDDAPLFCSPRYAAPEVLDGRPTAASDLYSLGIVLAEMLTGAAPWPHEDPLEVARLHLSAEPVPLSSVVRSSGLGEVIATATRKSLGDRYAHASEMLAALHRAIAAPSNRETVTGAFHASRVQADRDAVALSAPPVMEPLPPPVPAAETRPVLPAALRRVVRRRQTDEAARRAALPSAPMADIAPRAEPDDASLQLPRSTPVGGDDEPSPAFVASPAPTTGAATSGASGKTSRLAIGAEGPDADAAVDVGAADTVPVPQTLLESSIVRSAAETRRSDAPTPTALPDVTERLGTGHRETNDAGTLDSSARVILPQPTSEPVAGVDPDGVNQTATSPNQPPSADGPSQPESLSADRPSQLESLHGSPQLTARERLAPSNESPAPAARMSALVSYVVAGLVGAAIMLGLLFAFDVLGT